MYERENTMRKFLSSRRQQILVAHKRMQGLGSNFRDSSPFNFDCGTTCSIFRTVATMRRFRRGSDCRIIKQSLWCRAFAEVRSLAMGLLSRVKLEINTTDAADTTRTCSQFLRKYIGVSDSLSQKSDFCRWYKKGHASS